MILIFIKEIIYGLVLGLVTLIWLAPAPESVQAATYSTGERGEIMVLDPKAPYDIIMNATKTVTLSTSNSATINLEEGKIYTISVDNDRCEYKINGIYHVDRYEMGSIINASSRYIKSMSDREYREWYIKRYGQAPKMPLQDVVAGDIVIKQ